LTPDEIIKELDKLPTKVEYCQEQKLALEGLKPKASF
jgi:hypothetical protein